MNKQMFLEKYSDKSVVVRGAKTQLYKNNLKLAKGKYNAGLRGGPGWIFRNSDIKSVDKLIADFERDNLPTVSDDEYQCYLNGSGGGDDYKRSGGGDDYKRSGGGDLQEILRNIQSQMTCLIKEVADIKLILNNTTPVKLHSNKPSGVNDEVVIDIKPKRKSLLR
jgi:hypothetical protein